ncbi:TetR family transcriptional regulator C-terminal domain-containing protein [Epibacterium ulvae]|uniref:TetR family transcriptional regulator C-terminal domain-containing protein n=1 Tax=Epibacterium ulvae TaxID=1156985 RepID=UPI001BFC9C07|nr:TetR family transcriptional regulator C-terminal domain-containing protein [Epibacterium ulvae]MBT8155801.1 TetR family transcriptional regulator C-terminal domain-containing protein [Epibacterium ulvae]
MAKSQNTTRIQQRNRAIILDAALDVFSQNGFRGSTVDQIAKAAGLSKPNLLYYYPTKESIFKAVLSDLLDTWLDPLRAMDHDGEPIEEIQAYVARKIEMSRDFPRESRLFAHEIIQGAPRMLETLSTELKDLVDEKTLVIERWMNEGKLNRIHSRHLIFSIWSLTQHYADFEVQVRTLMGDEDPYDAAPAFLETLYHRLLTPTG